MRVTQADGAGTFTGDAWEITDVTSSSSGGFAIAGNGDRYNSGGSFLTLPSDWRELDAPSDGNHDFFLTYLPLPPNDNSANFILRTEVRCFEVDNVVETLATTTFHNFDLDQGDSYVDDDPSGVYSSEFCRKFSCLVLQAGQDGCRN